MRRFLLNADLLPSLPPPTKITIGYDDQGMTVICREYVPNLWSCTILIGGDIKIPITERSADALLLRCPLRLYKERVKVTLCGVIWEIEWYPRARQALVIGAADLPDGAPLPVWVREEFRPDSPHANDYLIARIAP